MAHYTLVRPLGWTFLSALASAEMEEIDEKLAACLHEGGGTWALTDVMVIGGDGIQMTGPLVLDGTTTVHGTATVKDGGVLRVEDTGLLQLALPPSYIDPLVIGRTASEIIDGSGNVFNFWGGPITIPDATAWLVPIDVPPSEGGTLYVEEIAVRINPVVGAPVAKLAIGLSRLLSTGAVTNVVAPVSDPAVGAGYSDEHKYERTISYATSSEYQYAILIVGEVGGGAADVSLLGVSYDLKFTKASV